jgi:hypothetical protein
LYELYRTAAAAAAAAATVDDYGDHESDDDYDMAVSWIRRLVAGSSPRKSGLELRLFYVGFEVVKEEMGLDFLREF